MSDNKTRIHKAYDVKDGFVMLGNEHAQRKDMSYAALGMLTYMLSRPKDWEVYKKELQRNKAKRDKVNKLLDELESFGYLHVITNDSKESERQKGGKFATNDYLIYSDPNHNPYFDNQPFTEKPLTGKPLTVNQPLQIKSSTNKDSTNKEKEKDSAGKPAPNSDLISQWVEPHHKTIVEVLYRKYGLSGGQLGQRAKQLKERGFTALELFHTYRFFRANTSDDTAAPTSDEKIDEWYQKCIRDYYHEKLYQHDLAGILQGHYQQESDFYKGRVKKDDTPDELLENESDDDFEWLDNLINNPPLKGEGGEYIKEQNRKIKAENARVQKILSEREKSNE